MKWLALLAEAVNLRRMSGIRVLGNAGQAMRLFRMLRQEGLRADAEYRKELFGDSPHAGVYLSELKRELRERVVNTLLCMPAEETDSQALQAYLAVTRELAAVQQLLARGEREAAAGLAQRSIRQALKFQFAQQVVLLARIMYQHHASMDVNRQLKDHYYQLAGVYNRINQVEWELEILFNEQAFTRTVSKSPEVSQQQMEPAIEWIKAQMAAFPEAYRVHYLGYNVLSTVYISGNDHKQVIETCRQATLFFRRLNYPTPVNTVFSFIYKMIPSLIQLRQFEEAQAALDECLHLVLPGRTNWFATLYYQIVLGFYSANYFLSYEAVLEVKRHQVPFQALREQLLIAEAYVALFIRAGRIQGKLPSFRLGKFLNEVPVYSRDKRGMNINLLILQTLFFLFDDRHDEIIDRTEALQMYSHRYLRRDENFRSECFIRLLLLLPRHSFQPKAIERHARPLLDKLREAPLLGDYDVEIVPYAVLWGLVIEVLNGGASR